MASESEMDSDIYVIPDLLKPKHTRSSIVSPSDCFISKDCLEMYSTLCSTEDDATPLYMVKDKEYINSLIDFPDEFWNNVNEIQGEREAELLQQDAEKKKDESAKMAEELNIKHALDKQVDKILKASWCYVKRSCPVKIPYKSTMSHEEHTAYVHAFIKYQIRPPMTSQEHKEHQYYLQLQNKVFEEQKCMMNFSYQVARLQLSAYNTTLPIVDKYISDFVSHRCLRAQHYSSHYVHENDIPLKPRSQRQTSSFQLIHNGHLLSLGSLPRFFIPKSQVKTIIPISDKIYQMADPFCDHLYSRKEFLYKTPVSDDPNAEYLAAQHGANVVMSASTFKALANNLDSFDKEWDVPVRIKSVKVKGPAGKDETRRVVFLDKPLVRKSWLPLQKKFSFIKKVALGTLTRKTRDPSLRMKGHINRDPVPAYDDLFDDANSSDVEAFGEMASLKHTSKRRQTSFENPFDDSSGPGAPNHSCEAERDNVANTRRKSLRLRNAKMKDSKPQTTEAEGLRGDDCFLDSLLSKQDNLLKPINSPLKNVSEHDSSQNKEEISFPWSGTLKTTWNGTEPQPCVDQPGYNVHYQLYSFLKETNNVSKKVDHEQIKIVFRHHIHGLAQIKEPKAYVLYPKVENQLFFGVEVNSLAEIVEQWSMLAVRPNTTLMQVRICSESGAVVLREEKSLQSILKEGRQPHINFQPDFVLSPFSCILTSLLRMSSGDYILHHSPKTEAFVKLYKSFNQNKNLQSSFDLHERYKDCQMVTRHYQNPPWLAIDTHILTPFHKFHKKIPATFPMENPHKKLSKKERKAKRAKANQKKSLEQLKET